MGLLTPKRIGPVNYELFTHRDDSELITQILAVLDDADKPLGRWALMCECEITYIQCQTYIERMEGHGLVSLDHRGVWITDKGKEALAIYLGLVDMIRCE